MIWQHWGSIFPSFLFIAGLLLPVTLFADSSSQIVDIGAAMALASSPSPSSSSSSPSGNLVSDLLVGRVLNNASGQSSGNGNGALSSLVNDAVTGAIFSDVVNPSVQIFANDSSDKITLASDALTLISWIGKNVDNCDITGGSLPPTHGALGGVIPVAPDNIRDVTYTATCQTLGGLGQPVTSQVTVNREVYGVGGPREASYAIKTAAGARACAQAIASGGDDCARAVKIRRIPSSEVQGRVTDSVACSCHGGAGVTGFSWKQ